MCNLGPSFFPRVSIRWSERGPVLRRREAWLEKTVTVAGMPKRMS
jgi:hypothetical protein